jgi:hypothetical protein
VTEPVTGKGRPTPKRSEKVRRTGPVAPPPLTRKEAAQRQKQAAKDARKRIKEGAARGDERYLSPRDAGPVRALVRDTVDGRRNAGVLLLPLALVLIVANLSGAPVVQNLGALVFLATMLTVAADLVVLTFVLRRTVRAKHPEEERTRGHVAYGLLRSTVLRRMRLPAPRVRPGS